MKKGVSTFLFFLTLVTCSWAQEQTLMPETLFKGPYTHGFYLAPSLQLTHWQDRSGIMMGGRAAWILNQKVGIGLAGYGLMSRNEIGPINKANRAFLQAGYGGLLLEYTPTPSRLVHFSFPLVVGIGGGAYTNNAMDRNSTGSYSHEVYQTDTFFVLEPGVLAEVNVGQFMRLGLGASYRFAQGVHLSNSTDKDMSAPTFSMVFKFGKFE